jgi:N utilization substance protein A
MYTNVNSALVANERESSTLEDQMAGDNFSDLSRMIDAVSKEKSIDKQLVIDAVIQGMLVAARKKYGTYREIEAQYNEDSGEVELYEFKEVVMPEDFIDEEIEIKLDEARELNPDIQVNDSIGIKMDATELGRIAAQTAKQIITQKVRDAEREIIYNEFEQRRGEVASGIARRVERGMIVVDLGKTEAFIPLREQIPGEVYKPGDRVQGYLLDVRQTTRGPQIIMSRACEQYLIKLFEQEVPEIYDGIVQIVAAAREPGARAKIAVVSKDPAVDPVGACVGMKGSRVQQVVQELRGEKIDIINWDEDITRFACNALAPAEISRVFVDEANKEMEIVVPDTQLSLAIGRKGQNVRLASKITTWKLDISQRIISGTKDSGRDFQSSCCFQA